MGRQNKHEKDTRASLEQTSSKIKRYLRTETHFCGNGGGLVDRQMVCKWLLKMYTLKVFYNKHIFFFPTLCHIHFRVYWRVRFSLSVFKIHFYSNYLRTHRTENNNACTRVRLNVTFMFLCCIHKNIYTWYKLLHNLLKCYLKVFFFFLQLLHTIFAKGVWFFFLFQVGCEAFSLNYCSALWFFFLSFFRYTNTRRLLWKWN